RLIGGLVNATVTAIEPRGPTTACHAYRVAQLTVGLAETVDRSSSGTFSSIHFTTDALKEIEYAGLLHDFGKVGVREKVLVKAKKLYEPDRDLVLARFDYVRKSIETDALKKKLELAARLGAGQAEKQFAELDEELKKRLQELDD